MLKKIIAFIGIVFLSIITILNILFTAYLDSSEHIEINKNSFIYFLGLILIGILIFIITKIINKHIYNDTDEKSKSKIRKILFIISLIIYIAFNVIWASVVNPPIVGDQIHVCNLANTFYRDDPNEFLPNTTYAGIPLSEYMQLYHQQIPLAFVYSMFFQLLHFDLIHILRILNIIGNILTFIALYKISKQISKKHETNKVLLIALILTFIPLTMLSTFVYGDLPSLGLCLFSVYFMMKYIETEKIKYAIGASILTMIAYMMRMNSLIFVIATVMYLVFNLFNGITKRTWKSNTTKILIIIAYIIISIIPSTLVQNHYLDKYNMEKDKAYPNISYILMAMEESWRGNGWYNEARGEYALKNIETAGDEYVGEIKNRLKYFSENIGYTIDFYAMKITSMWGENTYASVRNNNVNYLPLEDIIEPLTFYEKALLILMAVCSIIVLVQNRKNLSLELVFLITIFIGGFTFHILWEAKSRYIIPYIVILIPLASVCISNTKLKEKLTKLYEKIKQ